MYLQIKTVQKLCLRQKHSKSADSLKVTKSSLKSQLKMCRMSLRYMKSNNLNKPIYKKAAFKAAFFTDIYPLKVLKAKECFPKPHL